MSANLTLNFETKWEKLKINYAYEEEVSETDVDYCTTTVLGKFENCHSSCVAFFSSDFDELLKKVTHEEWLMCMHMWAHQAQEKEENDIACSYLVSISFTVLLYLNLDDTK